MPDLQRLESVTMFRMSRGHDCLAAHLHHITIYDDRKCILCISHSDVGTQNAKYSAGFTKNDTSRDLLESQRSPL